MSVVMSEHRLVSWPTNIGLYIFIGLIVTQTVFASSNRCSDIFAVVSAPQKNKSNLGRQYSRSYEYNNDSLQIYGNPEKEGNDYKVFYRLGSDKSKALQTMSLEEFYTLTSVPFFNSVDNKKIFFLPLKKNLNPSESQELLPVKVLKISEVDVLLRKIDGEEITASKKDFFLWNCTLNAEDQGIATRFSGINKSKGRLFSNINYSSDDSKDNGFYILIRSLPSWPGNDQIKNVFHSKESYLKIQSLIKQNVIIAITQGYKGAKGIALPSQNKLSKMMTSKEGLPNQPIIVVTEFSDLDTLNHEYRHFKDLSGDYKIRDDFMMLADSFIAAHVGNREQNALVKTFTLMQEQRAYASQIEEIIGSKKNRYIVTKFLDSTWVSKNDYKEQTIQTFKKTYQSHIETLRNLLNTLKESDSQNFNNLKEILIRWEYPSSEISLHQLFPEHF